MLDIAHLSSQLSFLSYLLAGGLYLGLWIKSNRFLLMLSALALAIGLGLNIFTLVQRWVTVGQPPFKTLYESLVLFSACIAVFYLVVEWVTKVRILGFFSAMGSAASLAYALFGHDHLPVKLPPALQSVWFIPHVVVYFFGYAAIFVGVAISLVYLLQSHANYKTKNGSRALKIAGFGLVVLTGGLGYVFYRLLRRALKNPDLVGGQVLDLEYLLGEIVRIGFAMLTLGLLIGAAWAKMAWGDYWTWDPKETWALVSWLVFAVYLHLHYLANWRGRRLSYLVIVGFVIVLFTYLGMHLLPTADQSIHVYQ